MIEAAAELAAEGDPTVEEALLRFERSVQPLEHAAQIWVSVAFLLVRHEQIAASLPDASET